MTTYVWRDDRFVDKRTGKPMLSAKARKTGKVCRPFVRSDLPIYFSPVTGKPVEGRAARREDLARSGCREVDPSEFKPIYKSYEFCQKRRLPYMGGDVPPPMSRNEKMAARERKTKVEAAVAEAPFVRGNPRNKPIFKTKEA